MGLHTRSGADWVRSRRVAWRRGGQLVCPRSRSLSQRNRCLWEKRCSWKRAAVSLSFTTCEAEVERRNQHFTAGHTPRPDGPIGSIQENSQWAALGQRSVTVQGWNRPWTLSPHCLPTGRVHRQVLGSGRRRHFARLYISVQLIGG